MTFESDPNHETPVEKKLNPWLKLTLEMGPLVLVGWACTEPAR